MMVAALHLLEVSEKELGVLYEGVFAADTALALAVVAEDVGVDPTLAFLGLLVGQVLLEHLLHLLVEVESHY